MPVTEAPVEDVNVQSYAIRRVNPFLGVLQVIETESGRASTANGVVWDIEVRAERPGGWGSLNRNRSRMGYYRYGLWSEQDGLLKRRMAPGQNQDPLNQSGLKLIECIEQRLDQLPFALVDNRELWLFDSDNQQPLALLASVMTENPLSSPEPKRWSACIGAEGVPSQRKSPAATQLEAQVKQRAGFNLNKYWITRDFEGRGFNEQLKTHMEAQDFPPYLLSEHWPDDEQSRRVAEFIAWTAPSLLTLQHLSREQRARLEQSLNIQAESVEHHWHLYPYIIDQKCLRAAQVQCRIQHANRV